MQFLRQKVGTCLFSRVFITLVIFTTVREH